MNPQLLQWHISAGGVVRALLDEFSTFTLIPLIGAAYLLVQRREWFLASWAVAAELLFARPRFAFTVGSVVAAAVGVDTDGDGEVDYRLNGQRKGYGNVTIE
ncbi:MAG: hypothetical protein V5A38_13300 [Halolamina sp.]|uniref:hypothetical protein n=1 Tax=Halolamina sp. TaxID=1940283 RepID=UPI002FC38666